MKWLDLLKLVAPFILKAAAPNLPDSMIGLVAHGIDTAEQLHGDGTGAQKLAHVTELAATGLTIAKEAGAPVDVPASLDALTGGINETIRVVNLIHAAQSPT